MKAVVQRVTSASVAVEEPSYKESIAGGLCVFIGIEEGDDDKDANWMAKKLANLRIFRDAMDKMNCDIKEANGEILLISQFTLAGDCSQGNRPSFIRAAIPEIAEPLVAMVGDALETTHGITVQRGIFGAMMQITLTNDGPVTLIIQRD